ncbi:hypothetical protein DW042_02085 [Bacteroides xylanisolvens]|uniref:CRISPR-associated protein n=2 Tax=Bacteroidales TaxID=171549 RepID=W2CTZ0_9BACT|nr:hypothetical protein [Bacteroides xylanisolvens]ETK10528.1 hypothetical protein T231_04440 [Tannerella sp. oral taxon BU063 isolate Cell 6/7/9]MDB0717161.1 hypothetical protein [Bacteroides xylanisolvens]MDB0738670.1 hypothetical protein [Bacteroides xylanisolvens]RHL01341.1 hypothetical protein DW042_02085 [Bacteroides xylanisolvens]
MTQLDQHIEQWIQDTGNPAKHDEAKKFYAEKIMPQLLEHLKDIDIVGKQLRENGGVDTLFSVLGMTPAPIVITQHLLQPKNHVIFYDKNIKVKDDKILAHLDSNPTYVMFEDESFGTIYETMKEMLIVSEGGNMVIDITGGKKSMTAAAAIFAKDFDFNIVYVDMSSPGSYIPAIHQTRPGSERLNLVYSPLRDLPELFH